MKYLVWILPRVGFTCLPDAGVCFSVTVKAKGIYLVLKGYIIQVKIQSIRENPFQENLFQENLFQENPFQENLFQENPFQENPFQKILTNLTQTYKSNPNLT